jgi:phage terminase large subunit GpA-like protein
VTSLLELFGTTTALATPARLRSLLQFAEDEIVIPDGPYRDRRFRRDRHPVGRLLLEELNSGRWRRAFVVGPNQDGKTLLGLTIPMLHILFERKETAIFAAPSRETAADCWRLKILPVIKASRFIELLPDHGDGSRGGEVTTIEFKNAAVLRFMTGGGSDATRSSFTTSNLLVTEADAFDSIGSESREGDKFSQLERRTFADMEHARTLAECTAGLESGRVWREYEAGSQSRIALKCPHCAQWVTPERQHLVGWDKAVNDIEAIELAKLTCPACAAPWTNEQRIAANHDCRLVHRGQTVDAAGNVCGPLPQTATMGFRWSVVNSILSPRRLAIVAGIEWRAKRAIDEDAADRDLRQSQWALPAAPPATDLSKLDAFVIMQRTVTGCGRGIVPAGATCITVGCDVGKRLCHWTAVAWLPGASMHVIDYGRIECPCEMMAEEKAILLALRNWRDDVVKIGWKKGDSTMRPTFVFCDSRDWSATVKSFTAESGPGWFSIMGFGHGQRRTGEYQRETGSRVVGVGDHYNLLALPSGHQIIEANVDHWKGFLHARLHTPPNEPGALTLFDSNEHLSFAKHLTSEKKVEEFRAGEGVITRWEQVSRNNHWLDATVYAAIAGNAAGQKIIPPPPAAPPKPPSEDAGLSYKEIFHTGKW